jgi:Domain of unknown function (DUF4328)
MTNAWETPPAGYGTPVGAGVGVMGGYGNPAAAPYGAAGQGAPAGYAPPVYPSYHNPQYSAGWQPDLPTAKLTILSWLLYVLLGLSTVPLVEIVTDAVREAKQAVNPNGAPPPMKDGLVKAWWLVFLLSMLLCALPGGLSRSGAVSDSLTVCKLLDEVSMAYTVAGVLAALLAIMVVRHVTSLQNKVMGPRR